MKNSSNPSEPAKEFLALLDRFEAWRSALTKPQQAALAYATCASAWWIPLILRLLVAMSSLTYQLCDLIWQDILRLFNGGFSLKKAPFIGILLIAYAGTVLSGFLGGWTASRLFILLSLFGGPVFYWCTAKSRKWAGWALGLLIIFPTSFFAGKTGVNNAPLGREARELANKLIAVANNGDPSEGNAVSEKIRALLEREGNWFVPYSADAQRLRDAEASSISKYNDYQRKVKAEQEETAARAAQQAEIERWGPFFANFETRQQAKKMCNDYAFNMTGQQRSWFMDDRTDFEMRVVGDRVWVGGPITVKVKDGNVDGSDFRYQRGVDCYWSKNATSLEGGEITVE